MEKKTPLYDRHKTMGGSIVTFAGYQLPIQYQGVIEEHMAVRTNAGLFDVSHMGEISVCGNDALQNLNRMFTNDFTDMGDGTVRYTLACNASGGILDDLLIYRFSDVHYMAIPNASNKQKIFDFMAGHLLGDAVVEDLSDDYSQIALQGPKSRDIMLELSDETLIPGKKHTFVSEADVAGVACILSNTGYTGEPGYELYCAPNDAVKLWDALLEAGQDFGLVPCGLGARDTLRMEAGMPLYGHELSEDVTPLETGLAFAVKTSKGGFSGKEAILSRGAQIARTGLKITGRGIVRENCPVFIGGEQIGKTTSGTYLPYLKGAYAMAHLNADMAIVGAAVEAESRGKMIAAEIVPLPFYKRS